MHEVVITEKTSQARNVREAIGQRYGNVLPAEGHLIELLEPHEIREDWKNWSTALLDPGEPYGTKPTKDKRKGSKLKSIRDALKSADRVWIATDCDREGQLIGQEILDHYSYTGAVMRVIFNNEDPETLREAFSNAKPNEEFRNLYEAGRARQQADQIYNLSLTRAATVTMANGTGVIGVGRVKTPTLAIVCRRELEIRNFKALDYFEIVAAATVEKGTFTIRHAPRERILERAEAERIAKLADRFCGPLCVKVQDRSQSPPKLYHLTSLQRTCATRFNWTADHTLSVAQELYDGEGKKILSYPRAEYRYLPEIMIKDAPTIAQGLAKLEAFSKLEIPEPPKIRTGKSGTYYDKGLEGASHHAISINPKTVGDIEEIWQRLNEDERKLLDIVARSWLANILPDYRYRQTTATLEVEGHEFRATGRQTIDPGWRNAMGATDDELDKSDADESRQRLPGLTDGENTSLTEVEVEGKQTKPPPRYNDGSLVTEMENAWKLVDNDTLKNRLKEAKGIGTSATRGEVIKGLKQQGQIRVSGKHLVPTDRGLTLFQILERTERSITDPALTAVLECTLDEVTTGKRCMNDAVKATSRAAAAIIARLEKHAGELNETDRNALHTESNRPPSPGVKKFVEDLAKRKNIPLPKGYRTSATLCRAFLDEHAPKRDPNEDPNTPKPPSEAQVSYATRLAEQAGVEIPKDALAESKALSTWIEANKSKAPPATHAPSARQMSYAKRIAGAKKKRIPDAALKNARALSTWIDSNR